MEMTISRYSEPKRMAQTTTIQIDRSLKARLDKIKIHPRETYNDILERLLEDLQELAPDVKRAADRAYKEFKAGRYTTHEQLKRELGL